MGELMAKPQKENGFVPIANELVEQLAKVNLSSYAWRTLLALLRKTYGWNKKCDRISISQFQELTGISRRHQSRAIKYLVDRNIIIKMETYINLNIFHMLNKLKNIRKKESG